MPSVVVVIPGFGVPHWEEKLEFLRKNHAYIMADLPNDFKVFYHILQYSTDTEYEIPLSIFEPLPESHITLIRHPGLLGENLVRFARLDQLGGVPDYVFMMLDDIEMNAPVPWRLLVHLRETTPARILSPCLKNPHASSWDYMYHQAKYTSPTLILRNRCEFFVYFMTGADYAHYHSYISPENPFLWGMDFILASVMKLRPGILNDWSISHHYRGTSSASSQAENQAIRYIERLGLGLNYFMVHKDPPGEVAVAAALLTHTT
jgi:hypothetical protein